MVASGWEGNMGATQFIALDKLCEMARSALLMKWDECMWCLLGAMSASLHLMYAMVGTLASSGLTATVIFGSGCSNSRRALRRDSAGPGAVTAGQGKERSFVAGRVRLATFLAKWHCLDREWG